MLIDELKEQPIIVDLTNESDEVISKLENFRLVNEKHITRLERGLRFLKNAANNDWSEEQYDAECKKKYLKYN
ncbi:MAG: hypothetical protein HC836_40670 [Richelia sp. RM2_1_2]|nr:hypothetical protein [Richelia sp. RM2_1_2]